MTDENLICFGRTIGASLKDLKPHVKGSKLEYK